MFRNFVVLRQRFLLMLVVLSIALLAFAPAAQVEPPEVIDIGGFNAMLLVAAVLALLTQVSKLIALVGWEFPEGAFGVVNTVLVVGFTILAGATDVFAGLGDFLAPWLGATMSLVEALTTIIGLMIMSRLVFEKFFSNVPFLKGWLGYQVTPPQLAAPARP